MSFVYIAQPQPFWFVESGLLADLLRTEIAVVKTIRDQCAHLNDFLDSPDATKSQRKQCFLVLAHGQVMHIISELFESRYEPSPRMSEEDSKILNWIIGLPASDAPDWVLEASRVVDRLAVHLKNALPQPLRAESYNTNEPAQMRAIESAVATHSTLENLQLLTERVVDQQFHRLLRRWAPNVNKPNKRAGRAERLKLYEVMRKILDANRGLQGLNFCRELEKRHAQPLYDWVKRKEWRAGLTWKEAWEIPSLKRKIRRVRQEAIKKR